MTTRFSSPSRRLALGGIVTALSFLVLYAATAAPAGRAGFYFLTALLPLLFLGEGLRGTAFLSFAAVSVLGFFLLPSRAAVLPYVCFLGWYAIARDALAKRSFWIRKLLLLLCFDGGLLLWAGALRLLTGLSLTAFLSLPLWTVVLGVIVLQPLLLLLDWFFGLCSAYYTDHIRPRLMPRG